MSSRKEEHNERKAHFMELMRAAVEATLQVPGMRIDFEFWTNDMEKPDSSELRITYSFPDFIEQLRMLKAFTEALTAFEQMPDIKENLLSGDLND